MEYGLQIGQAIQYEWFRRDNGSCRFYSQWSEFNKLRLYARGEQSVAKYKNELAVDGDLSYLNLDWTPVPIIPKFIDIVVNGMSDRLFKVKAYAQDALSAEKRTQFQEMVEADMVAKPVLSQMTRDFDIDVFNVPEEELPESSEELELFMNLKYKPAIEIACEEAINTLLDENHYTEVRKRVDYDIATLGTTAASKTFTADANNLTKITGAVYMEEATLTFDATQDWDVRASPVAKVTLTNKSTPSPTLGTLLMVSIAVGCMIGGPMSPTGGARNALMIGFLGNMGIDISFMGWLSMGFMYTVVMSIVMAFLLPLLFKPEVDDLSEAVGMLKKDLEKHGAMTSQQKIVAGVMALVVLLWITDKSIVKEVLGFSLGLGGIAISGAVMYMLFGLTSWKDYEDKVSWGVIVLYAGCISLGIVFKNTGASSWFADQIMMLVL